MMTAIMSQVLIVSSPFSWINSKEKSNFYVFTYKCIRIPIQRTISRSRDSSLRYNSPLSMEILNHTKQQYISQNYVIPRACAYTVCNMW